MEKMLKQILNLLKKIKKMLAEGPREKIIKLSKTASLKLPTGIQYTNSDWCVTMTEEIAAPTKNRDEEIAKKQVELDTYVDTWLLEHKDKYINLLKSQGAKEHRFTEKGGVNYPHVTNILTPDTPQIPHIQEYASQGNALDEVGKQYCLTGEIISVEPKPHPNIKQNYAELYQGFTVNLADKRITLTNIGELIFNDEFIYCGTPDAFGLFDSVPTIFDFKRSVSKKNIKKYWMQMAAYCKCLNPEVEPEPELMVLISPDGIYVEGDIQSNFHQFLLLRGVYKERFGL